MFCKKCGSEIPTGASECPKCGKAVETIMVAEEKKTETVAEPAPVAAAPAASTGKKAKSDKLTFPLVLLIIAGAGLAYLYVSGTFSGIYALFVSTGDAKSNVREEMLIGTESSEIFGSIGAIAIAGLFGLLALAGLVLLFVRLGRKFSRKD